MKYTRFLLSTFLSCFLLQIGSVFADEYRNPVKSGYNLGCIQRYTPKSYAQANGYWLTQKTALQKEIQFLKEIKTKPLFNVVIKKSGEIQQVSVLKPSESLELDNKAVEVIQAIQKLEAMPDGFPFNLDSQVISYRDLSHDKTEIIHTKEEGEANRKIIRGLEQHIKRKWHTLSQGQTGKKAVVVLFVLDLQSRRILNPKIITSSCDLEFDALTLKTLHDASPLPRKLAKEVSKLPSDLQTVLWDIEFVFETY